MRGDVCGRKVKFGFVSVRECERECEPTRALFSSLSCLRSSFWGEVYLKYLFIGCIFYLLMTFTCKSSFTLSVTVSHQKLEIAVTFSK